MKRLPLIALFSIFIFASTDVSANQVGAKQALEEATKVYVSAIGVIHFYNSILDGNDPKPEALKHLEKSTKTLGELIPAVAAKDRIGGLLVMETTITDKAIEGALKALVAFDSAH